MSLLFVEEVARSCALGCFVWIALAITQQNNPHIQKTAWTLVLLASVAMPFFARTHVLPSIQAPSYVLTPNPTHSSAAHVPFFAGSLALLYWLPMLWLLWRLGSSLISVWRIRRAAKILPQYTSLGLDVRVSDRLLAPATFGSTILLPIDFVSWNKQKLEAVLAHERSHVVQGDCYVVWVARLYACVCWFNPMAWCLLRQLTRLAEHTSDDAAAHAMKSAPAYAEILLEFAAQRPVAGAALAMAQANISARIERVLRSSHSFKVPSRSRRLLVIAALLPAVAAIAAPLQPSTATPGGIPSVRITNYGDLTELSKYYPPDAKALGIEGVVELRVTLDAQGRATDTLIVSETPQDLGFGAAASAAAHTMEYSNPTGHPVQLSFQVKFALK